MPIANQFLEAAASGRTSTVLDAIARITWRAHAEGQLTDAEAEAISEALQARRRAFAAGVGLPAPKAVFAALRPARRPPSSPDRRRSLERRRRQATSGIVPSKLASAFTMGELAVLTVIGRQCQRGGACTLHIDAIAALAGVCRTVVKNALRAARAGGLILVKERRIPGRKSLTNVVTVISREWLAWLRLGGIGGRNPTSPVDSNKQEAKAAPLRGGLLDQKHRPSGGKDCIRGDKRKNCASSGHPVSAACARKGRLSPLPTGRQRHKGQEWFTEFSPR